MSALKSRIKKYFCDWDGCLKAYSRPSLLDQHRRTHWNERNYVCSTCSKTFLRKSHLKVHQWTHTDVKPLSCPYCRKGFTTNQQLSRHINTHQLEKTCPYSCGVTFPADADIYTHILEYHLMSEIFQPSEMKDHPEAKFSPYAEQTQPTQTHDCSRGHLETDIVQLPEISPISTVFSPPLVDQKTPHNTDSVVSTDDGRPRETTQRPPIWFQLQEALDAHTLKCLETICLEFPDYDSIFDLIQHYDTYHHFIPLNLFPTYNPVNSTTTDIKTLVNSTPNTETPMDSTTDINTP